MKKRILLIALSLIAFTGQILAQELEITWGESFDSNTDVQKILGVSGNKMAALTVKGKNKFIETYDVDKGYVANSSEQYIVPKLTGMETGLLNIALRDGKIMTLVYGFDKKAKSFSIHTQTLTLEGKQIGNMTEIYSSSAADEKIKDRIVDVRFSPDQTQALMFFDRTNADRTRFFSDVVVLDLKNGDKEPFVGKFEFEMRSGKSESVIYKMYHSIDNSGNNFFISEKIELTKKVISDFTLSIKGLDSEGAELGNVDIKDQENVLLSPTIVADKDNFIVVGYYMVNPRKRANVAGYGGLFTAKLNKDLSVENMKLTKFSDQFFLDLYSAKRIQRMNEKGNEILVPAPYTMDNIILHTDGTMTVLSEYYLVTVTDNGKGQKTTMTQYGNIIYYKLNAEGEILSSDVIKKMQASGTSSIGFSYMGVADGLGMGMFVSYETKDNKKKYWSYAMATDGENIYLVFNDHLKNMEDDEDDLSKALSAPSKSVPYLVTISSDGSFKKKAMIDAQDTDTYCVPQITYPLDETQFIIWGVRRNENKFGLAKI